MMVNANKRSDGRPLGNFKKKVVQLLIVLSIISIYRSWLMTSATDLLPMGGKGTPLRIRGRSYPSRTEETAMYNIRPFCHRWSSSDARNRTLQPFDLWYMHHPTWIVTNKTEDMFCVAPGDGTKQHPLIGNLVKIYANQFHSSCAKVHVRKMWSSGWGADFLNMQAGIVHAMNDLGGIPLVLEAEYPWHYTANKNDSSNMACPAADSTCYFLPYHGCGPLADLKASSEVEIVEGFELLPTDSFIYEEPGLGRAAYFFLARKQLWLRRAVFDYAQQFKKSNNIVPAANADCTVVHVRRADVVLHGEATRRYFPLADYVRLIPGEKLDNPDHHIFLLTDDANAIDEAREFFPKLPWRYFDRPRHRGSSGGWENQTPSRNPRLETIVLLATFELAKECSAFVHGHSNWAEYIWQQMLLFGRHDNVERYRVEGENPVYNPLHNTSEAELEKSLQEMRGRNGTIRDNALSPSHVDQKETGQEAIVAPTIVDPKGRDNEEQKRSQEANVTSNIVGPDGGDCSDDIKGIIILNVLGLLANDMFEAAFARRMASELGCGWHVIYRTMWYPAFPTARTDVCFPNALASDNNRDRPDRTKRAISKIGANGIDPTILHDALMYNELEPENHAGWDDSDDRATKITKKWVESLGERALTVAHDEYPLQEDNVDKLVSSILDPSSPVQVLDLGAFFIHWDWMSDWMDRIGDWLRIDPSCCATPALPENAIVIHIRDFLPEDEDKNKNLQVGVYRDIINTYHPSTKDREVIVVCQPKSAKSDLVLALAEEFDAEVRTGTDNIDAMCLLARARGSLILSTSSSFSEMGALLAEQNGGKVRVHYPTHTLDHPAVTMNVPSWKYHLVNRTRVVEFDVDHERLEVTQA